MNESNELQAQILELKQRRNAIILAHNYQIEEVQLAADFLGDSLELSRKAAALSQARHRFCRREIHGRDRQDPVACKKGPASTPRCRLPHGRHDHRGGPARDEGPLSAGHGRHLREFGGGDQGGERRVLHVVQCRPGGEEHSEPRRSFSFPTRTWGAMCRRRCPRKSCICSRASAMSTAASRRRRSHPRGPVIRGRSSSSTPKCGPRSGPTPTRSFPPAACWATSGTPRRWNSSWPRNRACSRG